MCGTPLKYEDHYAYFDKFVIAEFIGGTIFNCAIAVSRWRFNCLITEPLQLGTTLKMYSLLKCQCCCI